MKWLLLLVLVSCGKHQEPTTVDLYDHDGDQKVAEEGFDKYTADFDVFHKLEGKMSFITTEKHELEFSNMYDPASHALRLMVGSLSYAERDQFFMEGSRIKLEVKDIVVKSENNTINMFFKTDKKETADLVLVHGKASRVLGRWSEYMNFVLSRDELESVARGKSFLMLDKKFRQEKYFPRSTAETIREKTHKVIVHDGQSTTIHYVSKSLPREDLFKHLNVEGPTIVDDESLFFDSLAMSGKQWFLRSYENGDLILAKTTLQELKKAYADKFDVRKDTLRRENGTPVNVIKINGIANKTVFLKIRASATQRKMREDQRVEKHLRSGSQGEKFEYYCTYFSRSVVREETYQPIFEDFLLNLIALDIKRYKVKEQRDEKGSFWEVMLFTDKDELELQLAPKAAETFHVTGDYNAQCGKWNEVGRRPSYKTNEEGFLKFDVESFVERSE